MHALLNIVPFGVPSLLAGEHTACGDLKGKDAFLNEESPSYKKKEKNISSAVKQIKCKDLKNKKLVL